MSIKKAVLLSFVGVFALMLVSSNYAWGKAHVRIGKVQVCHTGDVIEVITVSVNALPAHLRHGDCQLPACDFNNVFATGNVCDTDFCTDTDCCLAASRESAEGITPACPPGTF